MNAPARTTGSWPVRSSLRTTGNDLANALQAIAAGPHSAQRRAEEALERTRCPRCGGDGWVEEYDEHGAERVLGCTRCGGAGWLDPPEPEEDDLPETDFEKRAAYHAEEEENERNYEPAE